ncbi:MAG TPA: RNA 2',3'-cyclic phosphodiesterase [Candidatus Polarisedimenticolaceae bacterium]|nr:RNA 2',3'-cyclic phosphodiesterase [Candidatus Polarisedimenticolaceae bacterium]
MRAFLAIPLPAALVASAAAAARTIAGDEREWRLARDEGLHVTLRFLGEVDRAVLSALEAPVAEATRATPGLTLVLRDAGAFPSVRRPRILWLGVEDRSTGGVLAALAAQFEDAARAAGLIHEARPFFPHVTLARARTDRARCSALETVGTLGTFDPAEVVLFRSILGRGGARYEIERRFPVGRMP